MGGPLSGTRVVELGAWVAGPACGGILADWGADVVKVEPPGGDPARQFAAMLGADIPVNPPFELDNRGKRSVVLDLSDEHARSVMLELIERADVFVTNIRPGALARLGFDHATLLARHPRLVYAMITGYGLDGPDADRAAYDIGAFWARAGVAALLTPPGGAPPFQRGGMGDHGAGMALAAGVCAALLHRDRTGEGQLVHVSLLRHGMYTIGFDLNTALRLGVPIGVATRESMGNPVINSYRDRDGRWFWLIGLEADRHWPDLARAVGHPEWLEDPRFSSAAARRRHCAELVGLLDAIFATRPLAEWAEAFDREGVWWAPVQSVDEVLADPQAWAAGGFIEVPDRGATATMIATPVDFEATPWAVASPAPRLGEHTDAVLRELGHTDEQIAALREAGSIA